MKGDRLNAKMKVCNFGEKKAGEKSVEI